MYVNFIQMWYIIIMNGSTKNHETKKMKTALGLAISGIYNAKGYWQSP